MNVRFIGLDLPTKTFSRFLKMFAVSLVSRYRLLKIKEGTSLQSHSVVLEVRGY